MFLIANTRIRCSAS